MFFWIFYQVVDIVHANFEGRYNPVFLLDHSPVHRWGGNNSCTIKSLNFLRAKPKDGLNARTMNVKGCQKWLKSFGKFHKIFYISTFSTDGGKQPLQRAGYYKIQDSELRMKQHMVFQVYLYFIFYILYFIFYILYFIFYTGWEVNEESG